MKNDKIVDLTELRESHEKMKGTQLYNKYSMETYSKNDKGRWFFIGWGIPFTSEGKLQKLKDKYYLHCGDSRYTVNDNVNEILKIY